MKLSGGSIIKGILGLVVTTLAIGGVPDRSEAGGTARYRSPADQLRCGPGVTNHPVNVVPSSAVEVPDDWPLGPGGTITCLTCHRRLPSLGGVSNPSLRDFDEAETESTDFCTKCHGSSTEHSAAAMHWMAVGVAHVKTERTRSRRRTGLLDHDSRRCMGCHDGVSANEAANTTVWNRGPGALGDRRRNHPVGVPYRDRAKPRKKSTARLRPTSLLPAKVRLPDGQVSCVSCHDLYAPGRHRLTVPIEGSALCFSCHDMD